MKLTELTDLYGPLPTGEWIKIKTEMIVINPFIDKSGKIIYSISHELEKRGRSVRWNVYADYSKVGVPMYKHTSPDICLYIDLLFKDGELVDTITPEYKQSLKRVDKLLETIEISVRNTNVKHNWIICN